MNFQKHGFYWNVTKNDNSNEPIFALAQMHDMLPKYIIDLRKWEEKSQVKFHILVEMN